MHYNAIPRSGAWRYLFKSEVELKAIPIYLHSGKKEGQYRMTFYLLNVLVRIVSLKRVAYNRFAPYATAHETNKYLVFMRPVTCTGEGEKGENKHCN